ncbi:anti-sigma factor [Rhizobium sp. ARZ01]|uniref:anti-sigma factor family protein n=1 Tax=Rhizobium sp. ARZ01 TaxID=2769313 RepID=UPI001785448A|nr:anti-sigma factor [Rhizobium sp. ARZ01]MBD9373108.1 anti-sigma factor [Rhizobium sp. ARZ01]
MESTQGLPLEVRLSAYLDGQLPHAEVREIDGILAHDEKARTLFNRLKLGSDLGRKAFEDMLHEPVPLDLVRNIKLATIEGGQSAGRLPPAQPVRDVTPFGSWARLGAAGLVLLLASGSAGYLLGTRHVPAATPVQTVEARDWLDDIAGLHRIYARQTRHLAEVPPSEGQHITEWLASAVGMEFKIPDLTASGLAFEGARLLVAAGSPTAQLLYKDADGQIFSIYFQKSDPVAEKSDLTDSIRDDLGLIAWQNGSASYVVVGPSSDPALEAIAKAVAQAI